MANIRQIPWRRILIEGAVIVVSILLAFSIDTWWNDRIEHQRFNYAGVGPGEKREIQRLFYLTSHLNTDATTPIENWKVLLASDCRNGDGSRCR